MTERPFSARPPSPLFARSAPRYSSAPGSTCPVCGRSSASPAALISVSTFAYSFLGQSLPKSGYRRARYAGPGLEDEQADRRGQHRDRHGRRGSPHHDHVRRRRASAPQNQGRRLQTPGHAPRLRIRDSKVAVNGGETSKVNVALDPRPSRGEEGENPIKKFFRGLGL